MKKNITTYPQGEATYSKVLGVDAQGNTVLVKTEDIALNSGNIIPIDQRLNAQQVFGTNTSSVQWSPFQSPTLQIVNDYVEITKSDNIGGYGGIRADGLLGLFVNGTEYIIELDYQSTKTVGLYLDARGGAYEKFLPPITEWTHFTNTFTMNSSLKRVQICYNAFYPDASDYIRIKNFSVKAKVGIDVSDFRHNTFFNGKKLSVIGDSISTCNGYNAVQFTVLQSDIDNNRTLTAYPTYYDINKTIGGVTVTAAMVGTEQNFTPVAVDLGKTIGEPLNYSGPAIDSMWWKRVATSLKMEMLANVSWSGASISSHEGDKEVYKTSYAWHPAQIAKLAQRDTDGNLVTPDVVIVYRGTNDFSHSPYTRLGTYNAEATEIPQTDVSSNNTYFRDAYAILISKIREAYPNAMIFICTLNVFKRITYDHYPTRNGLYTLPQMNNAIREVADAMGVGLIEFDKDGITFENCYSEGYITDSATTPTHPNAKGHLQMAKKAVADMLKHITSI